MIKNYYMFLKESTEENYIISNLMEDFLEPHKVKEYLDERLLDKNIVFYGRILYGWKFLLDEENEYEELNGRLEDIWVFDNIFRFYINAKRRYYDVDPNGKITVVESNKDFLDPFGEEL